MHKIDDSAMYLRDLPAGESSTSGSAPRLMLLVTSPTRRLRAARRLPSRYLDSRLKRAFDIVAATVALAFFAPLLILIAMAVRLSSRGPILFVQARGGKGLEPFGLFKFRSMYVQPPGAAVVQATEDDQRITPLGRILRKTSADELPQLLNVLRGEMSIIGPRPHAVEHDAYYSSVIERYTDRAKCKPGITGLAQVKGFRGATPTTQAIANRVDADLQYIETASFSLDVSIFLQTAWSVLACRNAY